ncbi:MAG: sigma 54-interacting transcriptional regulator [Erythrobacter sp.]|uniref:sigma-54 interaction domain-containing protein n=1 Tax=Erythrobacter sp. TaxID=1042 RepID=UPI002626C701|nr:sigma 54-interacting transcriptional regulator [Erythrobacter sp.]MDJ0979143.1 sigma 54-interacting transcriptional regulator [Erythrobacter sp.]
MSRPRYPQNHAQLLEPVLPLLGTHWQRARLSIGELGTFSHPPGCPPEERLELDLRLGDAPALARLGEARVALTYNSDTLEPARAALTAIASWSGATKGGWPIARDETSLALLTLAERIAGAEIPVLLEGPTGTGKEVLARFVHRRSRRKDGPFVAVNCAAMPEAMLEGLLFGHRKGAFTGAGEAREGLFCAADGGTLLLDEIGELPLPLQAKLLRALQEGEVLPLGATKPIAVDVRVIAATNRHLASEVEAGRFREDLLYRLNVFPLEITALRDRPGDIAPLAFGMLLRHACGPASGKVAERAGPTWLSGQALALLETHIWPGNVRELENVIRRALLLAGDAPRIGSEHIVFDQAARAVPSGDVPRRGINSALKTKASLSDIAFQSEAEAILAALAAHDGHRAQTARALGISERTLRYRLASMRKSGLLEPDPSASGRAMGGGV